ncbi:hypothetical protein [uncultured Lamprocystis sp.]|jgi:hypothetical protein|uniref:hypothetical protein n=1 Tax=uncultured Lamprocystis sp. TaxID=543132 RepID=UPI0025D91413|nr:hypothetical protein [uncultured Lamprocystis sp.]
MLEYVFFQEAPRKHFQDFLTAQGLAWTLEPGNLETLVVVDEAGLDDELAERIEAVYDELFSAEQSVYSTSLPQSAQDGDGNGIVIQLPNGGGIAVALPQELLQRILTVITAEELGCLVGAIARALTGKEGAKV